jgi:hypothetical protein
MATKPSTLPQLWASDVLYTTGPFVGSIQKINPGAGIAAQGHRPGAADPTAAEYENYQQFWIDTWIREWLYTGSSAGASDAHIVETTNTGRTALTGLDVTNAVAESGVISITNGGVLPSFFGRNTLGPVYKAFALGGNGPGFEAVMGGGANKAFTAQVTDETVGLYLNMVGSTGNGGGISIDADAASSNWPLDISNYGSSGCAQFYNFNAAQNCLNMQSSGGGLISSAFGGICALFVGNSASDPTVKISENAGSPEPALDVKRFGGGAGSGIRSESTASFAGEFLGTGVAAIRATTTTASAVSAVSSSGSGVSGTSTSGAGGTFVSSSGAGITATSSSDFAGRFTADTTSPTLGTLFLTGQDARPTSNSNGQISYLSTERQFAFSNLSDAGWRGVWTSTGGYTMARGTLTTKLLNAGAAVWSDVLTITANNGNDIKVAFRTVLIRISCEVSSSIATNNILNLRVIDDSDGGAVIFTRSNASGYNQVYSVGGIPERSVCVSFLATPQATGTQIYRLQMASNTAASNLTARDITMDFLGQS